MEKRKLVKRGLPFAAEMNPALYAFIDSHLGGIDENTKRAIYRAIHSGELERMSPVEFLEQVTVGTLRAHGVGEKRFAQIRKALIDEVG